MLPLADIQRASQALGERGLDAAGRGDLHEARRLLLESVQLSDDDPRYLKALGYCAFAVGDIGAAYQAWRKAELLIGGRGSIPWVRSLEHGILRITVDRYNSAITLARQGKYRDAVNMLDRVLQEVPDFVPAGKAKGLALLATDDRIGAHKAFLAQRELCSDDPELNRLIEAIGFRADDTPARAAPAIGAAAAGLAFGATAASASPGAAPPTAAVGAPAAPTTWAAPGEVAAHVRRVFPPRIAAIAAALLVIVAAIAFWPRGETKTNAGSSNATAVAPPTPGPAPTVVASVESAARVKPPPPSQRSSFTSRYKQGAAAVHRGDWQRAISYLGPIGEFGAKEPFHAHVLAMLAQSYESTSRRADARRMAWMLVQKYPNSEYITAELREIAGVGEEHEK